MLCYLLSVTDTEHKDQIEQLYRAFHQDALRFAASRFIAAGRQDASNLAEDAVQNAFYKLAKNAHSLPKSMDGALGKTYLFSCVANEVSDVLREEVALSLEELPPTVSDGDFLERLCLREHYGRVVRAIERLDDRYSTVLLWRFAGGLSVKRIADLFGIKKKTVYTRLDRAKKLLLTAIKEEGE